MIGTTQVCECHGREVMARVIPDQGVVAVQRKTHGTYHYLTIGLADIVQTLDPQGTTYRRVSVATS